MTQTTPRLATRPPGRPRSERADKAIIEATLDLLAEETEVAGVSVEAVAARAGVGKTTIYRRWPGKEALIVSALAALKEPLPEPTGTSVRDDLLALADAFQVERGNRRLDCFWNMLSGGRYPELADRFTREVIEPRREVLRGVLRRGVENGELRRDIDIEVAMSMLIGAITARARAIGYGPIPEDFSAKVVDVLLLGLAAR